MQKTQVEFAFDAYVQGVQLRKATKSRLSKAIRALQKIKLTWAWEFLSYMPRNRRISRLRASK
eukprot:3650418-Rhodomonas_salina.1